MNNISKAIVLLIMVFNSVIGFCSSDIPPTEIKNNFWYKHTESDTAIVFVHGIFGNSSETWQYHDKKDSSKDQYWPKMISEDDRFSNVSIYLGGYATSFDSGKYGAPEAAKELWNALSKNNHAQKRKSVMDKDKIVFVCHSTGGIIVRDVLYNHREDFKDKVIGLVLIASPSYGSKWANNLNSIINIYDNDLAKILKYDSTFLEQLDDNFKDMKDANLLPFLVGSEALEHHFIIHHWFWPDDEVLVDKLSGGRYFSAPEILANTDHFSTVKPNDRNHPGYMFLSNFYLGKFKNKIIERTETNFSKLVNENNSVSIKFESIDDNPQNVNDVLKDASLISGKFNRIPDDDISLLYRIKKYQLISLNYLMSSIVDDNNANRIRDANESIKFSDKALSKIDELNKLGESGNDKDKKNADWIKDEEYYDRVLYQKAFAQAIKARQEMKNISSVRETLNKINTSYLKKNPPSRDLKWAINIIKRDRI